MSAAQDAGRARNRWPEHLSLVTEPVEQRRRVTAPTPQPAHHQTAPARQAPRPTTQQRPVQQRPAQVQVQHATPSRQPYRGSARLTAPQLRRRWLGGIASALLVGATLPVQLGAVAIESLELLSPGPDGSAMTVVLSAMAVQFLVVLIPMLAGPAIGGFTRRWRARLLVLSANAVLVSGIALIGWMRVGQL